MIVDRINEKEDNRIEIRLKRLYDIYFYYQKK